MIELFDWQEEVKDMISQLEFVRMVDVQSETIDKYEKREQAGIVNISTVPKHPKFI